MSTADEIKKLNELLRERVISQEEFDAEKDKLLKKSSPSESDSQWVVTLLLAFLLGVIGAHRFYVGENRHRNINAFNLWRFRNMAVNRFNSYYYRTIY